MADDQPRPVVTLVHGTFAPNAVWTRPDSTLCAALQARFGDRVLIQRVQWSGRNNFSARRDGAAELRDAIVKHSNSDARHVVIAHSHAGNIVTYAAMNPGVNRKIAGIVTLATPFIVARRRNLGQTGQVAAQAFALIVTCAALYLTSIFWPQLWAGSLTWNLMLVIGAVALLVELPMLTLVKRWAVFSEGMLEELQHARIENDRFLILRAVADEATGVITAAQFPSVATTLAFGALARLTDGYVRWCIQLMQRPLRAVLFVLVSYVLMLVPLLAVLWLTDSQLLMLIVAGVWTCLTWGPFAFLIVRQPQLAMIVAAGPMALLVVPVIVILAITAFALGPRLALANLYLDVSVEATPIGHYDVILMDPPAAGDPNRPGGMLHSALYDDEETIGLVGDFVAARLGLHATVPREPVGS